MRILNRVCPHCGTTGQMFLDYQDGGWVAECLICTCIVKPKGVPAELNPAKFTSVGIQSPSQVHSNYKVPFGGKVGHLFGSRGDGE